MLIDEGRASGDAKTSPGDSGHAPGAHAARSLRSRSGDTGRDLVSCSNGGVVKKWPQETAGTEVEIDGFE